MYCIWFSSVPDVYKRQLMDNAQKVYAGMTYGKGRLTESFINDANKTQEDVHPSMTMAQEYQSEI